MRICHFCQVPLSDSHLQVLLQTPIILAIPQVLCLGVLSLRQGSVHLEGEGVTLRRLEVEAPLDQLPIMQLLAHHLARGCLVTPTKLILLSAVVDCLEVSLLQLHSVPPKVSRSLVHTYDSPLIFDHSIHNKANSGGAFDSVAPVTTGTASTPFSSFGEKDSANSTITLQYQSITAMPSYRGSSFEVR